MKNLNFVRKLALIIIVLISVFLFFLFWNLQSSSKEINKPIKIESTSIDRKLLIVTESSPFKDLIIAGLLDYYKFPPILVEIVDGKTMANTDAENFDAILVLHRWEARAPSRNVQLFLEKNEDFKNRIVMLTTSWNGLEKMENIDAITGASIMKDVPVITDKIIKRLDGLLKYKK